MTRRIHELKRYLARVNTIIHSMHEYVHLSHTGEVTTKDTAVSTEEKTKAAATGMEMEKEEVKAVA